jgi:oxygen-dependent protoporphyrinogen oxidase
MAENEEMHATNGVDMAKPLRVIIIGGGITGLVAAYTLRQQVQTNTQQPIHITLLEASGRLGGKIQTVQFADMPVDTGAEGMLLQDAGQQLLQSLGLSSEVLESKTVRTNIWTRGHLRPLPDGMVMGVPTDPFSIMRSGIVSPLGMLRAGMDIFLPRTQFSADPTIHEVLGSRLGTEMVAHLVEPLLGSIHAGKADRLSLAAVAPSLAETAQKHRSLILGLRPQVFKKQREQTKKRSVPQLYSFTDGLNRLIQRLHECLEGVDIHLESRLQMLERGPDGTYHLTCSGGTALEAESVILAAPAWEASRLLQHLDAASAQELGAIEHASVMVTHLSYRCSALAQTRFPGTGFLVPRADGRLMNACTWVTRKWPRQSRLDRIVLRCSAGRAGDERAAQMSDDELLETIHHELTDALGIQEHPVETLVTRWERAFPQYHAGHHTRVARVETMLTERLPGIALAGAAYHGGGLASCMKDGIRAAERIQAYLGLSRRNEGANTNIIAENLG